MWISQDISEHRLRLPRTSRASAHQRLRFRPRLEGLEERMVLSTLTVLNTLDKGAGSLRDTITNARSGDTIVFAASLDGQTITLTSDQLAIKKSLDIEGPGAGQLAISGNDTNRVFDICEGLTVTIAGLTIEDGLATGGGGGGILNVGSTVNLSNDVLSNNTALGNLIGNGGGGAISNRNGATLTVSGCMFSGNQALGASNGDNGDGGGILSVGSTTSVIGSTFTGNRAVGGDGGAVHTGSAFIGIGSGGAI